MHFETPYTKNFQEAQQYRGRGQHILCHCPQDRVWTMTFFNLIKTDDGVIDPADSFNSMHILVWTFLEEYVDI